MSKSFDHIVKKQFEYLLKDFHFRLELCKKIRGRYDILYVSDICAVHIVYEIREAYLFITLHKLQNGIFVDNPRPIKPDSLLTGYSLNDILLLRAPHAVIRPAYSYGAKSEYYDKEHGLSLYVSKFADNLKSHAADVLVGDFKIFDVLEPIVKKRAQQNK
jgi:hypothetical protein